MFETSVHAVKKQKQHKQQIHVQMASFNLCISQTIQELMRQMYRNYFCHFIFFFLTLLLYSKMHWLDMSSIARQYIHISYTDVFSNVL